MGSFLHAYARQKVWEQRKEVIIGEKALNYPVHRKTPIYNIVPLETSFPQGTQFVEKEEVETIETAEELKQLGFLIIAYKPKKLWFRGQKIAYKLEKVKTGRIGLEKIPSAHTIQKMPLQKLVRIVGRNAGPKELGEWENIELQKPKHYETKRIKRISGLSKFLSGGKPRMMARKVEPKPVFIKDIPFLITTDNKLLCVENERDIQRFGIVGAIGNGKTLLAHTLIDGIHYKFGDCIFIPNEDSEQIKNWSLPMETSIFTEKLDMLNHTPRPLPIIYLYPKTNDLSMKILEDQKITFEFTLPYKEVIKNYEWFFNEKEWQLPPATFTVFRTLQKQFLKAKTWNDIIKIVNANIKDKDMKKALLNRLGDIWQQQILDITTKTPSMWKVNDKEDYPFFILMDLGIIPVVMTPNLITKRYFYDYQKWLGELVFNRQDRNRELGTMKRVWLFYDELDNKIIGSGRIETVAKETMIKIVKEGRWRQLGVIYTLQNYSKIEPRIITNTTHLIAFGCNEREAKMITKDFEQGPTTKKQIVALKKFEAVAMCRNDRHFVLYDEYGNKKRVAGAFKGTIIPSTSQHSKPGG